MKVTLSILALALFASCASKPTTTTSQARQALEDKWSKRLGSATKADFVQDFGNAEWCRPQVSGEETCRFYKKLATKWMGDDIRDKKSYEAFDEVVADFDTQGALKGFKANAQR